MEQTPNIIDRIAIRDLDWDIKQGIAQTMIDDVDTTIEYWSQMLLSVVIATLWLLINATPVVIWAMLIAPIMRPIQGVSFAIATGNRKLFGNSLRLLFLSIFWGIAIAWLITWLIPLTTVTNEIASRTQPTLIDLGIAFASGLVAFLALWYRKMSAWLAGVAMAASLVPPLWVIGIGIAFGSRDIGWGSSLLFVTNLVAIIIGGILVFYIFWFYPNQADDLKRSIKNTWFVVWMLLLIMIPLASSLIGITKDIRTQSTINDTTNSFLSNINEKISVENLEYDSKKNSKNISLSIKAPQSTLDMLDDQAKQDLTQQLAANLNRDVELDVTIIPVTSVTKKEAKELTPEQKIRDRVSSYLEVKYEDSISLVSTDYYTDKKRFAVLNLYTEQKIKDKGAFEAQLYENLQRREDLVDIMLVDRVENYTEPEKVKEQKDNDLEDIKKWFDTYFTKETNINNIDLVYITDNNNPVKRPSMLIALNMTTTASQDQLAERLTEWKNILENAYGTTVDLEVIVEYLDKLSF